MLKWRLAAGALAVATALAALLELPSQPPTLGTASRPVHVLQSEGGREWMETIYRDQLGQLEAARVLYQNGVAGVRSLRPDGKVTREIATADNGEMVLAAHYAETADQIISGFKRRLDGTAVWSASVDEKSFVTTVRYWYDGKRVFSTQRRRVGSPNMEETYFHLNGKRAMHFVGSVDRSSAPSVAEVWNEAGVLIFSHYTGLNDTSQDTVYRDDGTRWYKQTWASRAVQATATQPAARERLLLKVELFDDKGELGREFIMADDGYILRRVVEHTAPTVSKEMSVTYDGTVTTISEQDASGRATTVPAGTPREPVRIGLDSLFRRNRVGDFDPMQRWREHEDLWSL